MKHCYRLTISTLTNYNIKMLLTPSVIIIQYIYITLKGDILHSDYFILKWYFSKGSLGLYECKNVHMYQKLKDFNFYKHALCYSISTSADIKDLNLQETLQDAN